MVITVIILLWLVFGIMCATGTKKVSFLYCYFLRKQNTFKFTDLKFEFTPSA